MATEKRLIDAKALREAVITDYYEHFTRYHDTDQIALIDMVCDCIEESPTVDAVEVVHGRWEVKDDFYDWELKCSLCGEQYWIEKDELETHKPNYCPRCGAKMDGDGNGQ